MFSHCAEIESPLLLKCASVDATHRGAAEARVFVLRTCTFVKSVHLWTGHVFDARLSSNFLPRLNLFDSIARKVRPSKLLLENLSNCENRVFLRGLNFFKDALARQNFSRGEAAVTRLHLFQGDAGFIQGRKIDREQA